MSFTNIRGHYSSPGWGGKLIGITANPISAEKRLDQNEQIRLWKAATQGDREALADLFRNCQDTIYRFCLSQLRDQSLAVDATQETAMRLMKRLSTFDPQNRFSTWVLGYALNVCRELRRENRKQIQHFEDEMGEAQDELTPADLLFSRERQENIRNSIDQLAPRQKEAIVLRYFESLPLAEVAEVMELKTGTVKATLNQALKNLRKKLG